MTRCILPIKVKGSAEFAEVMIRMEAIKKPDRAAKHRPGQEFFNKSATEVPAACQV